MISSKCRSARHVFELIGMTVREMFRKRYGTSRRIVKNSVFVQEDE